MVNLENDIISNRFFFVSDNGSLKNKFLRKQIFEEYKTLRFYGDTLSVNKKLVKHALNKKIISIDELINLKSECVKGYLGVSVRNVRENKIFPKTIVKLEKGLKQGYFSKKLVDESLRKHDIGYVDNNTSKIVWYKQ